MCVLAAVLVVVIVGQLPPGVENQPAEQNLSSTALPAQSRPQSAEATRPTDAGASEDNQLKLIAWPEISLQATLANDPFALPAWAAPHEQEAAVTSQEPDQLAEYQKQGASIVVITASQKSATIGEQRVRVGDILAGYKVSDITTDGILVDKLEVR
jgi:hypothetical protein